MTRATVGAALLAATVCASQPVFAMPVRGGLASRVTLATPHTYTLHNGVTVSLVRTGVVPKAMILVVQQVGFADELPGETNFAMIAARLVEEDVSEPSPDARSDAFRDTAAAMISRGGADESTITADVVSDNAASVVRVLADAVVHPRYAEASFRRVVAAIKRDATVARARQQAAALGALRSSLFGSSAYARTLTEPASLDAIPLARVAAFHERAYGPRRTHLYVIGNYDEPAVVAAVQASFGTWSHVVADTGSTTAGAAAQPRTIAVDVDDALETSILIGHNIPSWRDPDGPALAVADAVLGGSASSRIAVALRTEHGIAYSPRSEIVDFARTSYWAESADVKADRTGEALEVIRSQMTRLAAQPPTGAELDGAKRFLLAKLALSRSSRTGLARELVMLGVERSTPAARNRFTAAVAAVTAADVARVAASYFAPARMVLVLAGKPQIVDPLALVEQASAETPR